METNSIKKIFYIVIFLFFTFNAFGANYYIDASCANDGDGSHNGGTCAAGAGQSGPYNTIVGKIAAGSDYRMKCGSSETITTLYTISNVDGTSGDHIIIGAYYIDGGNPVHEDNNPSFGSTCGNSAAKPILTDTDTTGTILKTSGSDYIEFNSIQLKKGETSLNITGDYNFVKYCYFEGAHYAIRMDDGAGDPDITSPYIGYSYFEGAGAGSGDGIHSRYGTTYMTVEYCEFDEWSHGAITSNYHTSNGLVSGTPNTTVHDTIRYNYIKNTSDMDSEAIIVAGNGIEVYHNWAEDAGNIHITMGSNIKVHHNVINNTASGLTSHSAINIQDVWEHDMTDIDVYNNVVYFDGTQGTLMDGIRIFDGHTGSIMERINIRNNVVLNCNRYSFDVVEYAAANEIESNCNDTDCNKFNNNIAYGWTGSYYARVEGSTFTTAALFNDGVDGTYNATPGNLETDPSFKDPANDKFYPESNTDPVIDAGYNVGASYDDYLTKHSDFSGSPPYVSTQQEATHDIGAYTYSPYFYVDCSAATDGIGTYSSPFKYFSKNSRFDPTSTLMSSGDGVYFKEGVTCTLDGTNNDDIVIDTQNITVGCYDNDQDFSCDITISTGAGMPKFDGGGSYPSSTDEAFIRIHESGVTVQDIWVHDMDFGGIQAHGTNPNNGDSATIQRNRLTSTWGQAIYGTNSDNSEFAYNWVTGCNERRADPCGTIEGAAMTCDWGCEGQVFSYNTVFGNYGEGIGSYVCEVGGAEGVFEYNTLHNNRSAGIHLTDCSSTIRYNLVGTYDTGSDGCESTFFNSGGDTYPTCCGKESNSGGIVALSTDAGNPSYDNLYKIYGNFVHGYKNTPGIVVTNGTVGCNDNDTVEGYIYNNTVVDSDPNFRSNGLCDDNKPVVFKNNISVYYDETANHCEESDTGGNISWDRNLWDSTPNAACQGSNDPSYADADLATQTGFAWPTTRTAIDRNDFKLSVGSPAVGDASDAAENLGSPYNKDYWGNTRGADGYWDFGAHELQSAVEDPVSIEGLILQ